MATEDRTARDSASALGKDVACLVRQELTAGARQLKEGMQRGALGTALLAGAGVCGVVGLQAGVLAVLRLFEARLPRPAAAATLAGVFGVAAAGLATAGVRSLAAVRESTRAAVADVDEDVRRASTASTAAGESA